MSQAAVVIRVWVRSRTRGRCKRHNLLPVSLALQLTAFIWFPSQKKPDKMMYSLASTMGLRTSAHFFHFELIEVSLVLFCHLPFRSLVSVCLGHSLVVHFHVTGLSSLDCKTVCNKTLSHRMCQIQTCHKYYDRLFYQTMARSQEAKQC